MEVESQEEFTRARINLFWSLNTSRKESSARLERLLSFGTAQKAVELAEPAIETANDIAENVHQRMEDAEPGNLANYISILTTIQGLINGEMNNISSRIAELNNNNSTGFHTQEIASQTRVLFVLEYYLAPVKAELGLAAPIMEQKRHIK